jgi:hypothetical protein
MGQSFAVGLTLLDDPSNRKDLVSGEGLAFVSFRQSVLYIGVGGLRNLHCDGRWNYTSVNSREEAVLAVIE